MPSLLIADRDPTERAGLSWLVSSCAIPYDKVHSAGTTAELFQAMESHTPEVVCIELDMIDKAHWERLKLLVAQYRPTVLVTTSEATFERAMQGIELSARDLWLKPQTPEYIRRVLTRSCQERAGDARIDQGAGSIQGRRGEISYRDLFLPGQSPLGGHTVMLAQLEDAKRHPELLRFFADYPFRDEPVLLPTGDAIVAVFPAETALAWPQWHQFGKRLLMDWEATSDAPLFLVIYKAEDAGQSLQQKYEQASQALQLRFFKGYRQVSMVDGKVNWTMLDPFLTPAEQRAWIDMLHSGNREQLKQWLYAHFFYKDEPYPEPGLLRIRLTSILAQVRRYMKSHGLDSASLEEGYHRVFETILYAPILYRIVTELLLFINQLLDTANDRSDEGRADVIEQAMRYMEGRYTDPALRLEDVARHVDRSPAYFSTLFAQKQGSSFRQVLTAMRVKEAQRLLLETALSVQEVAERSGFVNANYFSKIFKEKTGTTPRLLRNQKKR
ncbi:AraC family transcriptional regulator [Brevibacillus agri]|uniref:helix-turn-helix domain-containing protein n=1 Tax=Brevibacillus agri TaxID=51101 RepID=UPI001C8D7048|nr:helix-turn-helix domain-containing protein [Brevibacillus agri]MBY0052509.1 response regulator transcription factor [Brevibacillus agri]MED3500123.1 AraC family transcriptional regulator [Brevibacillus agri]